MKIMGNRCKKVFTFLAVLVITESQKENTLTI